MQRIDQQYKIAGSVAVTSQLDRHTLKYRPDIDGLRGLAVLAVVLFHAFPLQLAGGFAGVDVFFVISGFLISGILFSELKNDALSLTDFYVRRIRRIFPCLIAVLIAALVLGWLYLFPLEYPDLGRAVLGGAAFSSNIQLWRHSGGYFDLGADRRPLLHLWSLGVEEQFYLIWPPLLLLCRRRSRALLSLAICVCAISFGANIWLSMDKPNAAFYLPVSRFWEMLIGAILAWVSVYSEESKHLGRSGSVMATVLPARVRTFSGLIGVSLITLSFAAFNSSLTYPFWWALMPTMGTGLAIAAGPRAWPNRFLLGHPLLVFIGLISYPLYLWHWLILVFSRLLQDKGEHPGVSAAAVAVSVLLAWITYRFVERPIRRSRLRGTPILLCTLMTVIALAGAVVGQSNGFSSRFPAYFRTGQLGLGVPSTTSEKPVFALIGDSHAAALFPGLVRRSEIHGRWGLWGKAGCLPLVGVARISSELRRGDAEDCVKTTQTAISAIGGDTAIRVVVITVSGRLTGRLPKSAVGFQDDPTPQFTRSQSDKLYPDVVVDGLSQSISFIENHRQNAVFVIDNPMLRGPEGCIDRISKKLAPERSGCTQSLKVFLSEFNSYFDLVAELQKRHRQLSVFNPTRLLCPNENCSIAINGNLLYSYTDHLSDFGNSMVANELVPFVKRVAAKPQDSPGLNWP